MGVTGLWTLLEPVGRRINVEALSNKKLAVDASIWLMQFIKAMRDEKGDIVKNAHLLGFFRRICRLLFHRIRPVFVFDGATPALKRRTVIARRRRREQQNAKLKKTAEKLLMNQLKQHALTAIKNSQSDKPPPQNAQPEELHNGHPPPINTEDTSEPPTTTEPNQEQLQNRSQVDRTDQFESGGFIPDSEDLSRPGPSSRPPQNKDSTGLQTGVCEIVPESASDSGGDSEVDFLALPADVSELDPEILFTLPPSMQYEVLLKLREKQFGENREKFESLRHQPEGFSDMQMETYLKASAFRRQLDEVRQKVGRVTDEDGLQVQKIASQQNSEFILHTELEEGSGHVPPPHFGSKTLSSLLQGQKPAQTGKEAAEKLKQLPKEENLDITFEVPGESSSEDLEWEEVEDDGDKNGNETEESPEGASGKGKGLARQKFWSLSHGFKLGRSLATWSKDDVSNSDPEFEIGNEDAQMQEAIRRSLETAGQGSPIQKEDGSCREAAIDLDTVNASTDVLGPPSATHNQGNTEIEERNGSWREPGVSTAVLPAPPLPRRQKRKVVGEGMATDALCNAECGEASVDKKRRVSIDDNDVVASLSLDILSPLDNGNEPKKGVVSGSGHDDCLDEHYMASGGFGSGQGVVQNEGIDTRIGEVEIWECEKRTDKIGVDCTESGGATGNGDFPCRIVEGCEANGSGGSEADACNPDPKTVNLTHSEPDECCGAVSVAEETPPTTTNPKTGQEIDNATMHAIQPETCDGNGPESPVHIPETSPSPPHSERDKAHSNGSIEHAAGRALDTAEVRLSNTTEVNGQDAVLGGSGEERLDNGGVGEEGGEMNGVDIAEQLVELETEAQSLEDRQKRLTRHIETPTAQMYAECQELLQMFGLPYIIAPMEAEAQCAFLDSNELVDGVVTEDNDVFLFGGRRVYKNLFENKKYVEEYITGDAEQELGLDRAKLIRMAMLLGSDYTEGISGIGIVNAMEVVQAFPSENGLADFKEWVNALDEELVAAAKARIGGDDEGGLASDLEHDSAALRTFKLKHRGVRKNWELPESFPNSAVFDAYKSPKVDASKDRFTFGRPDLEMLRVFCRERFGWDQGKVDELLVPVLKAYDRRENQLRIDSFLSFRQRFAKIKSQRLQRAVEGITGSRNPDLVLGSVLDADPKPQEKKKESKKRKSQTDAAQQSGQSPQDKVQHKVQRKGRSGNGRKDKGRQTKKRKEESATSEESDDGGICSDEMNGNDASNGATGSKRAVRATRKEVNYREAENE